MIDQNKVDAISKNQPFDFGDALTMLINGQRVMRSGWKNIKYIELQSPDENSKMKQPYIYACPLDNNLVPWTPSQVDIFAKDWLKA